MTLTEIEARITALVTLGGWSNSSPAPDYADLANTGLQLLTRETCHLVEDYQLDLIRDQKDYDITDPDDPRPWIAFNDDAQLNDTIFLPQSSRDNIRVNNRMWRSTASSTPFCWYWAGKQKIGVYPGPSASGDFISFQGPRHEPVLVDGTDAPIVDEDFHEGICLFGAWHHGKLYARGEERDIVKTYLAEAMDYVKKVKDSMASQDGGLCVRRVQRAPQEYMGMGPIAPVVFWPN